MKNRRTADSIQHNDKLVAAAVKAAAADAHHQKTVRRIRETLERSRKVLSDWGNPDTQPAVQNFDEAGKDRTTGIE